MFYMKTMKAEERDTVEERRRNKRLPVEISLEIESLYRQGNESLDALNESIVVTDVSKSGLGFVSSAELPMGYYFNGRIEIDQERKFFGVMKIIRKHQDDDGAFHYGCEFVGMADILTGCLDEYQQELGL